VTTYGEGYDFSHLVLKMNRFVMFFPDFSPFRRLSADQTGAKAENQKSWLLVYEFPHNNN